MIITDNFVMLNFPKTGSSFARHVIKEAYRTIFGEGKVEDLNLPNLLNPVPAAWKQYQTTQHGFHFQIPFVHRGKETISIMRDPWSLLLSEYYYGRWRTDYTDIAVACAGQPNFPFLDFPAFVDFSNTEVRRRLREVYSNPCPEVKIGLISLRFIGMFFKEPYKVLAHIDDNYIDSDQPFSDLAPIHFLQTDSLRHDLVELLTKQGLPHAGLDFIYHEEKINERKRRHHYSWSPDLVESIRHHERLVLRIMRRKYGVEYPPPDCETARVTVNNKTHRFMPDQPLIRDEWSQRTIASLASIRARAGKLGKVLDSLKNQTPPFDEIHVYCNDWEGPVDEDVMIHRHPLGDINDRGKFYNCDEGYNFTCDDDLLYPPDYLRRLKRAIDTHHKIVGVHGVVLPSPIKNYFNDRGVYHFSKPVKADIPVHLLGTGTLAWHSALFKPDLHAMDMPGMADCYLALQAQQQRRGMICVSRPARWLVDMGYKDSLWAKRDTSARWQTEILNRVAEWHYF